MRLKAEHLLQLSMAVSMLAVALLCPRQAGAFEKSSSETLARLNSDRWTERYSAYKQIVADGEALKNARIRNSLVELLDKENHVTESVVLETHRGTDETYGEGYAEYTAMLLGTVDSIANWSDPREVCIIAHSSYNPESPLAMKLGQRASIVPCLMEMANSTLPVYRYQAVPILVDILASRRNQLSVDAARSARHAIVAALQDKDPSIRQVTVEALGRVGDRDMIPFITPVANSDSASYSIHGKRLFPVREAAVKAIRSIRDRSTGK